MLKKCKRFGPLTAIITIYSTYKSLFVAQAYLIKYSCEATTPRAQCSDGQLIFFWFTLFNWQVRANREDKYVKHHIIVYLNV